MLQEENAKVPSTILHSSTVCAAGMTDSLCDLGSTLGGEVGASTRPAGRQRRRRDGVRERRRRAGTLACPPRFTTEDAEITEAKEHMHVVECGPLVPVLAESYRVASYRWGLGTSQARKFGTPIPGVLQRYIATGYHTYTLGLCLVSACSPSSVVKF